MAIGADITRTFSPLAHSLPQPPSTRFFPERIKKTHNKQQKPQNNSPKSMFSFIVTFNGEGEFGLNDHALVRPSNGLQFWLSNTLAPNCLLVTGGCRFPDVSRRLFVTSCPSGSPSSHVFVFMSCLSSFVSHSNGCFW